MIILLILAVIAVPYVLGTALTIIFGDRSTRGHIRWCIGILSCFAYFFICLLVTLKLHGGIEDISRLFTIVTVSFMAGSVPVVIFGFSKKKLRILHFDKKILVWLIPGVVLGLFSIFMLKPDYSNDITTETARTILSTGKLYEYSSLLGVKAENGYPIFTKIEILPALYACLSYCFKTNLLVIIKYIAPIVAYSSNLFIMWEIATILVKEDKKNLFMIFHLVTLLAGTYLPSTAIPVTVGRPLLMQGFSGYAFGYGVLVPLMVLVLLQKRYVFAGIFLVPLLGLIKLDRIFFAFSEFFSSYDAVNLSGKLFILYILSVIWWLTKKKNRQKLPLASYLSGSVLISATLTDAYETFGEKKSFPVFSALLIMATCSFYPLRGAEFSLAQDKVDYDYIIEGGAQNAPDHIVLWAPEAVLEPARRESDVVFPVYGRDAYSDLLRGTNYEPYDEDTLYLLYAMDIIDTYMDDYVEELLGPELEVNRALDRVDVLMLPLDTRSEVLVNVLVKRGFSFAIEDDEYLIMRRYE